MFPKYSTPEGGRADPVFLEESLRISLRKKGSSTRVRDLTQPLTHFTVHTIDDTRTMHTINFHLYLPQQNLHFPL